MIDYTQFSDDDLELANRDLMLKKEEIRKDQLAINAVQTHRAQHGVRGVYATKDRPFRGEKKTLIEVPIGVSDVDLLKLQGIYTEERVSGLG